VKKVRTEEIIKGLDRKREEERTKILMKASWEDEIWQVYDERSKKKGYP
jgi:hypothetical protein